MPQNNRKISKLTAINKKQKIKILLKQICSASWDMLSETILLLFYKCKHDT